MSNVNLSLNEIESLLEIIDSQDDYPLDYFNDLQKKLEREYAVTIRKKLAEALNAIDDLSAWVDGAPNCISIRGASSDKAMGFALAVAEVKERLRNVNLILTSY